MKKYIKIFIIVLCLIFISGCKDKKENNNDGLRFIEEYSAIGIEEYDNVKYSDIDEVLDIIDNGSGVIYFGSGDNDLCLLSVPILFNASDNTSLDRIYYVSINDIDKEFSIKDKEDNVIISNDNMNIPLVLFVYDGNIVSYHVGTIDNKVELTDDESIELYNIYVNGIHDVLNDQCDSNGDEHC